MATTKPAWPHSARCTLTAHPNGQWCKKIRGKIYYFGPWADTTGAQARYLALADDLHSGQLPTTATTAPQDRLTIDYTVNAFLTRKLQAVQAGELEPRTYADYLRVATKVTQVLGSDTLVTELTPEDFGLLRTKLSPSAVRRGNEVTWIRSIFKMVADHEGAAVKFGDFKKPSKKTIRRERREHGLKFYQAETVRALLAAAHGPLRAHILLGINGGFGNMDIAVLPRAAVDLKGGIIDFVRLKTEVKRTVPLWPETIEAFKEYKRPEPTVSSDDTLFFLTRFGRRFVRDRVHGEDGAIDKVVRSDGINLEFGKLCTKIGVECHGFYALRHTFKTVADGSRDANAVARIMGHSFEGMDEVYVEDLSRDRLNAVVDFVRQWLWGPGVASKKAKRAGGDSRARQVAGSRANSKTPGKPRGRS